MSSSCPSNATFLDLTFMKDQIVDVYNERRNSIAGGLIPLYLPAVRMATMQWDDELAYVKTCKYGYDQCHNTINFKYSGQIIGSRSWYGTNQNVENLVLEQIGISLGDINLTNVNIFGLISGLVSSGNMNVLGELNTRVGCAAVQYTRVENGVQWTYINYTCNFARITLGRAVYEIGPAASECSNGTNPNYPFLCSIDEAYDVNVSF